MPASTFSSVDLPAPFSPTQACVSPAATSNDTSSSARTAPKDFETPRNSSPGTSALPLLPASLEEFDAAARGWMALARVVIEGDAEPRPIGHDETPVRRIDAGTAGDK